MAAVDAFLKLDGIKGESKDDKHKEEIDVLGWSWGLSQTGTFGGGGGGGAGKVSVHDISVTKRMDKSSPELQLRVCNGEHITEAVLVVRKAGTDPLEYFKVTLNDIIISSYSTGGSGGDVILHENISLNFAKFKIEYVEQDEKGKGKAPVKIGWDVSANKKL